MTVSAQKLLNQLKQGVYRPCYFIQGEESYYIDAITQYMAMVLPEQERSFNLTILYGREASMAAILTQARRFPMNGPQQVVIVKEAQEMADLKKKHSQELLLHYLSHPQTRTTLVFAHKYKPLDGRSSFSKALAGQKVLVNSNTLSEHAIPQFIQQKVEEAAFAITEGACWMIQTYVGNHLHRIVDEITKLQLSLKPGSTITEQIVQDYVGLYKAFNPFEFQEAVMQRNHLKSQTMIATSLLDARDQPILAIIALLYGFFAKLAILHQANPQTATQAAQEIGVPVYFIENYLAGQKRYTLQETLQNINYLHEADLQCKGITSHLADHQIMQELVFKLMHKHKA